MAQATERIGETFGIGLLHPGRAEGVVPRFVSRPAPRHHCGSFPRLECGGRPRRDRRQNANPVLNARGALSAPGADHLGDPLRHARKPCRRRSRRHVVWQRAQRPMDALDLGISFLSVAAWAQFPDKYEGGDNGMSRAGAFLSTLCAFSWPRSVTRPRSRRSASPRDSRPFTRLSWVQRSA